MQRLLVSVRGKNEALDAVRGGAHIADVEYPASALGTPYPLNIMAVRRALPKQVLVSTNIGETQLNRGTACQAAIGVALAGADIVKAGLGRMIPGEATYLAKAIRRSVKEFLPTRKVIIVVFADPDMTRMYLDPVSESADVGSESGADGVLIDTFDKGLGKGLLDYLSWKEIEQFAKTCHKARLEAWVAGSITLEQMRPIWKSGIDVVCVRAAACDPDRRKGRFAQISARRVKRLVATIPYAAASSRGTKVSQ